MDLRSLSVFIEVVRQGGFSAAGKTLFASQSTVSKAVKQLEDELGVPLLMRIGHSVRLTEVGNLVYRHAMIILDERDRLSSAVEEAKQLKRGRLKLGIPPIGSGTLFAPLLAKFRHYYPNIDIELQEQGAAHLRELVQNRGIDLGALLLPLPEVFEWQPICDEPLMVLLPQKHALAGRPSIRLSELADEPFILFEKGWALNAIIAEACHRRGFAPREVARSGQPEFVVALVAAGLGIGLLPRLVIANCIHSQIHAIQLNEEDVRWRLSMVWRRGDSLSPSAHAWLDLVKKHPFRWDECGADARFPLRR
ncbi:MAG: LysR family transcriptional regulator [Rhodospirillaceae bacterium]|nr:LysR family transcriptional regulator [Rhodospirillaceae bacterium]